MRSECHTFCTPTLPRQFQSPANPVVTSVHVVSGSPDDESALCTVDLARDVDPKGMGLGLPFSSAILEDLELHWEVDKSRIYVAVWSGNSNSRNCGNRSLTGEQASVSLPSLHRTITRMHQVSAPRNFKLSPISRTALTPSTRPNAGFWNHGNVPRTIVSAWDVDPNRMGLGPNPIPGPQYST